MVGPLRRVCLLLMSRAASLAVSAPPRRPVTSGPATREVTIVGGGIAGAATAFHLLRIARDQPEAVLAAAGAPHPAGDDGSPLLRVTVLDPRPAGAAARPPPRPVCCTRRRAPAELARRRGRARDEGAVAVAGAALGAT